MPAFVKGKKKKSTSIAMKLLCQSKPLIVPNAFQCNVPMGSLGISASLAPNVLSNNYFIEPHHIGRVTS